MTLAELVKLIILAFDAGDMETLEERIDEARPMVGEDAEPDATGVDPAPAPPVLVRDLPSESAKASFVRLYNAAKVIAAQGPTPGGMAALEAAVRDASHYVT